MKSATDVTWSLSLFGKLRITSADFVIDQFDTKRSALLLARLAISNRHAISRTDAADLLWPDDYYDATRIRLRQELSRLRRVLGPAREILETDEDWIRLVTHNIGIDTVQFEELFNRARNVDAIDQQIRLYRSALNLRPDRFLDGFNEAWIEAERRRLEEIHYAALIDLASLVGKQGDHEEALKLAQRAVHAEPLREAGHLLVMQELGQLGQLSDALEQYQRLKRLLREESQSAPSEEADRLAEALRHAPASQISPRSVAGNLTFNVPSPAEPIYGREADLERLSRLLAPSEARVRILTLTGPGGIGKTRLANEVAIRVSEAYDGRVAWIPVADLSDASLIPFVIVKALGVTIGQAADPMERLVALLPKEPILLLIDNVEQLLPEASVVIKALAEARPNLRILVTSRVALNLTGERTVAVPPLPTPGKSDSIDQPALRIFLDPLLAEQGYQVPSPEDMAIFRQIAEKLEGFPLALQLAAARLRTLTPSELLGQLDNRLDSLVNRRSDAPERHRTLRAALAGSYQALDPDMRSALGKLAVVRGGWTLRAAAKVCRLDDGLSLLESLLDSSLIRVDREEGGLRFRMFEAIRDFALEALTPEERLAAYREHADWMIEMGRPIGGRIADPAAIEHFKILDQELDNLREACRFTLEHDLSRAVLLGSIFGLFWHSRGLGREALRFLTELLARRSELPLTEDLARAAFNRSQLLQASHIVTPGSEGPAAFELAAELCEAGGLRAEGAIVKTHKMHSHIASADLDNALRLALEAAETLTDSSEPRDLAFVKHSAASVLYYQGRVQEAIDLMVQAKVIFAENPTPFSEVQNLQMMGYLYYELGDMTQARDLSVEGLRLAEKVGAKHLIPMIQEVLGRVALDAEEFELATQWAQASADGWEAYGNMFQYADQLQLLGRIEIEMGEPRKALQHFQQAASHFKRLGVVPFLSLVLHGAAKAWARLGEYERAARLLGASDRARKPTGDEDLGTELEYVNEIRSLLAAHVEPISLDRLLKEVPTVESALGLAF